MKKFLLFSLLSTTYLLQSGFAFAYQNPGNPTGFVNDFAGVFTAEQKQNLEAKLSQFGKSTTNEISVVTVKSLEGDTVENFAEKLFQEWGIGNEQEDNGALLLIAIEDRQMRIEVGYGLEGSLTDIYSSRIIRETLTPAFQQGDFYGGVNTATDQMIQIIGGVVPESLEQGKSQFKFNADLVWFVGVGLLWLMSILARSKSWWLGGVFGAILAVIIGFIFSFIFVGLIALAVFIPLGLLLDFLVSRAYQKSKIGGTRPPWWIGGGGFGSGHGGGGFGGFGGGMSGGGGASGKW